MRNCIFCYQPVNSGTVYAIVGGVIDYADTGDFLIKSTEGVICKGCFDKGCESPPNPEQDVAFTVGDTTFRYLK